LLREREGGECGDGMGREAGKLLMLPNPGKVSEISDAWLEADFCFPFFTARWDWLGMMTIGTTSAQHGRTPLACGIFTLMASFGKTALVWKQDM